MTLSRAVSRGQQVVALEDEADGAPVVGLGGAAQRGDLGAVADDGAGVGPFDRADHVQQRGLARAGGAGQRDERARLDGEGDVVGGGDLPAPVPVP